jgi:hypothetical protein
MNTLVRSWHVVVLILFLFLMIVAAHAASSKVDSRERRISFNDGWLFLNDAADGAKDIFLRSRGMLFPIAY